MTNFSIEEMREFVHEYNNTVHSTIKCTPREMFENMDLEMEWIRKCYRSQKVQKRIKDFNLPIGSYVRYRMNKNDLAGTKRRTQYSIEKYRIIKKIGNRYILQPLDSVSGGFITKSRFELIPAENKYPYGRTFYQSQSIPPNSIGLEWSDAQGWH